MTPVTPKKTINIGGREIGDDCSVFIIAEAGVNHNGEPALAEQLIYAAHKAGADAIKFQTFDADQLVISSVPKLSYQSKASSVAESQWEMLKRLELSKETFAKLQKIARATGIMFLSTPFDNGSAYFLMQLGVPAFKISSADITNHALLKHIAGFGKPIILSTGMATLGEVERAITVVQTNGDPEIALLHCTSLYPAPPEDCNLRCIDTMRTAFGVPVGYSDHTQGLEIPVAAAARGACIIEKHFTLSKTIPGPDQDASLEPEEFSQMVAAVRNVEVALGTGIKQPIAMELLIMSCVRRRITARIQIVEGTIIQDDMIEYKRATLGIDASDVEWVVGRTAKISIEAGLPVTRAMLL